MGWAHGKFRVKRKDKIEKREKELNHNLSHGTHAQFQDTHAQFQGTHATYETHVTWKNFVIQWNVGVGPSLE